MNSHELDNNKNNRNNEKASEWFDMAESLNNGERGIDMHEIDRSTNVGRLVGATLDVYEKVAAVADGKGLSRPIVLGSGAMYMNAINSGRYSMSELNRSYIERRNFSTTSHGVDIDFGFESEDEVDRLVAMTGNESRQIPVMDSDRQTNMADLMSRPPLPGFEPVVIQVGDQEVSLRNPEAAMFGKIKLLNDKPAEQIQQKWGYDVPMLMNIADSYRGGDGDLDEYLTGRYLEYQRASIDRSLQGVPAETRLGDITTEQKVRELLPKASDELIQHILDSRAGEIRADELPDECFSQWKEDYATAMNKYRQANILAAQRELDKVTSWCRIYGYGTIDEDKLIAYTLKHNPGNFFLGGVVATFCSFNASHFKPTDWKPGGFHLPPLYLKGGSKFSISSRDQREEMCHCISSRSTFSYLLINL